MRPEDGPIECVPSWRKSCNLVGLSIGVNSRIDLHTHTIYSDGLLTPSELLNMVRSKNLRAFSVTDHDTIEGCLAMRDILTEDDPELVPGIELSVSNEGADLHLLAYYFDMENSGLKNILISFCEKRNQRARRMVEKLSDIGLEISFDQVEKFAKGAVIGRPHIAETLARNSAVRNYEEAFSKYIGDGKPAFVPKENLGPAEAIKLVHEAGGVAVIAHPMLSNNDRHIEMMAGLGVDGIEAVHPFHNASDVRMLLEIAKRFRLIVTGGSDFHGREGRHGSVGSQKVPGEWLDPLKEIANRRKREMD